MNSDIEQSARIRPRPMTTRWSAVSAISDIRWLETNTVRPSAARSRARVRTQRMPSGSSPLTGSSRTTTGGSPSSATAMPSRWPMPSENLPTRLPATASRPTRSSTSSTRRGRDAVARGQPAQVVAGRAAGVQRPRLEQGADLAQRRGGVGVAVAVDGDAAGGGAVQAEDHPHRRRLAGAVRAEEAGHAARLDGEVDAVDGGLAAVGLGEAPGDDHAVAPRPGQEGSHGRKPVGRTVAGHIGGSPEPTLNGP